MKDTANVFCSILFDVLQYRGVRNVVCSPGSRNTPLLLAASARSFIKKHFVVDERSAAFLALGISMVSQEPVGLVCTSGTALLNYAPAIAEAYYQGIPLIVISADRPIQWIDQDDSQTLRQNGILDNFIKKSFSIPAIGGNQEEMKWYVNRIANEALLLACSGKPGPVHINIHISEPLGDKITYHQNKPRIINEISGDSIVNKEIIRELASEIVNSKVMLVCGFGYPDSFLQKAISDFSKNDNVVVMAETISNLHLNVEDYCVDSVLSAYDEKSLDEISPDLIISIGGSLVSRKLKEYLRRNANKSRHWSIGYSNNLSDPFMSISTKIEVEPSRFFRNINKAIKKFKQKDNIKDYNRIWDAKREEAKKIKDHFIENCEWSELKSFNILLNNVPYNYNLCLSNGTAIRYAQIINYTLPHASYCNRGVSGIDGSISTAIGASIRYKGPTLLVTGDLSMSYDIGALGIKEIPDRLKIVVIDNQGGGIFRFIPSTSNLEEREEYFCQAPILPLKELAEGYNWIYFEAADDTELINILPQFFDSPQKSILKIHCDGEKSAEILKDYMTLKV